MPRSDAAKRVERAFILNAAGEHTSRQRRIDPRASDLQRHVGEFGVFAFPASTPRSIVAHLVREVVELGEAVDAGNLAGTAEEAADCAVLLFHLAERLGFDLVAAAGAKHAFNTRREWEPADGEGVSEHRRTDQPDKEAAVWSTLQPVELIAADGARFDPDQTDPR